MTSKSEAKRKAIQADDIVTRLRELREVLMGNPIMAREVQEAMDEIERLRADRDRWRALAEYLCQNAPSVVVPDEIACQFPDPLVVHGE